MQCALAAEVARVENFKEVKFAAARSPAGTFRVRAVLRGEWYLGIMEPNRRHVAVEGSFAREWHGEFNQEELLIAGETVWAGCESADVA